VTRNNANPRNVSAKPSRSARGQGGSTSITRCARRISPQTLAITIIVVAVLHPLVGLAQPSPIALSSDSAAIAQLERKFQDAIARAEPSVVAISRVVTPGKDGRPGNVVGCGVIIDPVGLVLTQYVNVHEGDNHFVTTSDRNSFPAAIRAADARSGLAVLAMAPANSLPRPGAAPQQSKSTFPALPLGDADTLKKGQFVIAIGNPFAIASDGQATASWGAVTNLAQKAPVGTNLNDTPGPTGDFRTSLQHLGTLIQTDARLGWSTGGGALINLQGELVGITTTVATIAGHERPAGYAIPISAAVRRIIDKLKAGQEVEYGMLGVGFGQFALGPPQDASSRLTLQQVFAGGPAARAGLREGDAITSIDGKPVKDVDEVQLAVSALPPASTTAVGYIRGGQTSTKQLTLAKLAAVGENVVTAPAESWRGMRVDYPTALDALALGQAIASAAYDPAGCVLVSDVEENSEAWRAGVRKGMFVSHVGQQRVSTPAEFHAAARNVGNSFDLRLTKPTESDQETASKPE